MAQAKTGNTKPDYQRWDKEDEFDLWDAAWLCCDLEPLPAVLKRGEAPRPVQLMTEHLLSEVKHDNRAQARTYTSTEYIPLSVVRTMNISWLEHGIRERKVFFSRVSLEQWAEESGWQADMPFLFPKSRKPPKDRPHANAERYTTNREQVLGAAVAVLNKWPDQCAAVSAIATLIDQKASLFWGDGEPPLQPSGIQGLVNKWISKIK